MAASTDRPQILYSVRAQRGPVLRCKGWKQEALLRLLENNMENAEHPERLIIYGGIGKCARNWESYWALVGALQALENDETLVVQSGMPVAIFALAAAQSSRLTPWTGSSSPRDFAACTAACICCSPCATAASSTRCVRRLRLAWRSSTPNFTPRP